MNYKPSIILVNPTLSQNIGAAARAMLNFDLTELRLVNPKAEWLNKEARSLAADADRVLENAQVFDTVEEAFKDIQLIYATTARPRDLNKEVITPNQAAQEIQANLNNNHKVGICFGSEKCGLDNDVIALCHKIITVPLNPSFTSINLAQSLVLVSYEMFQARVSNPLGVKQWQLQDEIAPYDELLGLLQQLETELDKSGYFRADHKKPVMNRTLHNIFSRAQLSSQEVRSLRGVISSLVNPHGIYSRESKRKKVKPKETN
jgi:tRNA/rRNA methyltransferase